MEKIITKQFKGIIIAGGTGSRLNPITKVLNKNLLPVYNKPAIQYSIELLRDAGIEDIAIVAEQRYIDDFKIVLGNGKTINVNLNYFADTDAKKGPAQAVAFAKDFAQDFNTVVVAADNIFDIDISEDLAEFKSGAKIFAKKVADPTQFGIAEIDKNGNVLSLEEKPKFPKSNLAVPILHIYDKSLFGYIDRLQPAPDGEYYLTDINKMYLKQNHLKARVIDSFWIDVGTFEGLTIASYYWYQKMRYLNKSIIN